MGGQLSGGSHQWHLHAADLMPSVSTVSALLPAKHGPVQGQVTGSPRECRQTSMASAASNAHQYSVLRGIINIYVQYVSDENMLCSLRETIHRIINC